VLLWWNTWSIPNCIQSVSSVQCGSGPVSQSVWCLDSGVEKRFCVLCITAAAESRRCNVVGPDSSLSLIDLVHHTDTD